MNIAQVIKKYRKEAGLTQEEMAKRLGVTTPAVNKWENGNSYPDIELLAPIASLLHISLDTLLSFKEDLTSSEIDEIIQKMDSMFNEVEFEKVFEWAKEKIKEYPNCNMLIWQMAVILDARRLVDANLDSEKYDEQINTWYEIALRDESEEIKRHAADSLFGFYLRKKDFAKAEEYLQYFSENDPMKKTNQSRLYKEQGDIENAFKTSENLLFTEYQTLNCTIISMMVMAIGEGDIQTARYLAEKAGALAGIFEMGKYHEYAAMLDVVCAEKNVEETYHIVEQLLKSVDTLHDFQTSKLYQHMTFRKSEPLVLESLKEKLWDGFRDEEAYEYMKGNEAWEKLIHSKDKDVSNSMN